MDIRQCIDLCIECHRVCLETVSHCLKEGGKHAEATHIVLLMDCAQICATSADFMLRGSARHKATCRACAEICDACGRNCESMDDDAQMKRCADICRRCAESCRSMAG